MKTKAPTLRQFQARFPTEESCLEHLFHVRFGADTECHKCGREPRYHRVKARRSYECQWCAHQVYPTAGTPFHRTRTPLRDWFFVMFQFCATRSGVAAKEVERQIGVTYKTAWRMRHQIRAYMGIVDGDAAIGGEGTIVECDETYIGGVHTGGKRGRGAEGKAIVLGMLERDGDVMTRVVPNVRRASLTPHIEAHVAKGGEVHTDELASYNGLHLKGYIHKTVNHGAGEYVGFGGASVNAMEGFWRHLKASINGTHIHVSPQHLAKYLAEFEFRYNLRQSPHLMIDRLMVSFGR